jgi:RHS repeat-associated protein
MKTHYIWDMTNDTCLMEKNQTGATNVVYTNEPIQYGQLVSQRRAGQTSHYHFDGHGSTRQLTDQNQTVTDEYTYSAFGETIASSGTTTNPYQMNGVVGYYRDSAQRSTYVRRRSMLPDLARWLSEDPIGVTEGINVFTYANNSPQRLADPSGTTPLPLHVVPFKPGGLSCSFCTGMKIIWEVTLENVRQPTKLIIAQQILRESEKNWCESSCPCVISGTEKCRFVVFEFLGVLEYRLVGGKVQQRGIPVQDTWGAPGFGLGGRCEIKGYDFITSRVVAFEYRADRDPESGAATDPWSDGRVTPINACTSTGDIPVPSNLEVGWHLTRFPHHWGTPLYSAGTSANRAFECCDKRISRLTVNSTVGFSRIDDCLGSAPGGFVP